MTKDLISFFNFEKKRDQTVKILLKMNNCYQVQILNH